MTFSFGFKGSGVGVMMENGSCVDRQEPCDLVANEGRRCIGSGCSLPDNV